MVEIKAEFEKRGGRSLVLLPYTLHVLKIKLIRHVSNVFLLWFPLGPEGSAWIEFDNTVFGTFPSSMVDILIAFTTFTTIAICKSHSVEIRAKIVVTGHKSTH